MKIIKRPPYEDRNIRHYVKNSKDFYFDFFSNAEGFENSWLADWDVIINPNKEIQEKYVDTCFKLDIDVYTCVIPGLDLEKIQNNIDCIDLIK